MEDTIWDVCSGRAPERDWTAEEQQYIANNEEFRDLLLRWYWCTLSDGCWTKANCDFLRPFIFGDDDTKQNA